MTTGAGDEPAASGDAPPAAPDASGSRARRHQVLAGRPCVENSNVRPPCREQLGLLAGGDGVVVAVYDRDKLRDLEPTANGCTKGFVGALSQGCEPADRLRCVLLEQMPSFDYLIGKIAAQLREDASQG